MYELDSPGYMLTKLTKTILAHDNELKVSTTLWRHIEVINLRQKTWESLTPMGKVSGDMVWVAEISDEIAQMGEPEDLSVSPA